VQILNLEVCGVTVSLIMDCQCKNSKLTRWIDSRSWIVVVKISLKKFVGISCRIRRAPKYQWDNGVAKTWIANAKTVNCL
jgi:hypothetical protein